MENFNEIIKEYSIFFGIILILVGSFLIYYRIYKPKFFEKEDDYDTISGELNASYWGFALMLMIIGLILIFR